jgi:short-subunit dehydrogenase
MIESVYALVTGASSGIGWHIAKELAARGYGIVAVSNQGEKLTELRSELEAAYQVNVRSLDMDLAANDAATKVFAYCQENRLEIEVLVNNAGMVVYGDVVGTDIEQVRIIINLHMNTPVLFCRLFGKQMHDNQKGYILNVSSISAVMPYPTIPLYGPTKTFLRKFTRALRYEMKTRGVHVTCLLPGATATALHDPEKVNFPLAIRLGVMKRPEDVAKAGIKALFKNRSIRIPGMLNKFVVYFFPLIPPILIECIYRRIKKKKQTDNQIL